MIRIARKEMTNIDVHDLVRLVAEYAKKCNIQIASHLRSSTGQLYQEFQGIQC